MIEFFPSLLYDVKLLYPFLFTFVTLVWYLQFILNDDLIDLFHKFCSFYYDFVISGLLGLGLPL
jgi:hypothetical protein